MTLLRANPAYAFIIMSRKKKLPQDPVNVTIESLSHDGRGVAHVNGKVVFIDEALPGENIDFIYTDSRKDYAEGKLVDLHTRSEHRVDPACPHFGVCGGCSFQHVDDAEQIHFKEDMNTTGLEFWPFWQSFFITAPAFLISVTGM